MTDLPIRFLADKEQPEGFNSTRMFIMMKSSEFRKVYNKNVNPFFKKLGYKTSGFKALKEDNKFYYLTLFEADKYGGCGYLSIFIHPKELPAKSQSEWEDIHIKQPHQYIFKHSITLPNEEESFDLGINIEEAQETCYYLLKSLECQYDNIIERYSNYPEKILEITSENFNDLYTRVYRYFSLAFSFESKYEAALWISRIHYSNSSNGEKLAILAKNEFLSKAKKNGIKIDENNYTLKGLNKLING